MAGSADHVPVLSSAFAWLLYGAEDFGSSVGSPIAQLLRDFATRVGSAFKVLLPGSVQVSKFWHPGGSGFQSFATQVGPVRKEMAPQTASYPGTRVTLEPGSGP